MARLGIEYPVVIDSEFAIWQEYENLGWPARYLFGPELMLFEYHYGEGAYAETEAAIQELLGISRPVVEPVAPRTCPGRSSSPRARTSRAPYRGPYEAGGVWAVLDGSGTVTAEGRERHRRRAPAPTS